MNIGFAPIYPYRGSIQNMVFISRLLQKDGHNIHWLKCGGEINSCYNLLVKSNPKIVECLKCIMGGISSFDVNNVFKINKHTDNFLDDESLNEIVASTAYSLHRIEREEECSDEQVLKTKVGLYASANVVYQNAVKWIEDNELDLVFIYNGRLDMPRAVLAACKAAGVTFITVEAAYPGVALELNDDCRSTKSLYKITDDFIDKPLTEYQASFAGKIAAQMLSKKNLIWRLYNTNAIKSNWPIENYHHKILIAPSSSHEFIGLKDWTPAWGHMTDGIEAVLEKSGLSYSDCVLRCHPNWSENIGSSQDGMRAEKFYIEWASKHGVKVIPSSSNISTNELTRQSDIVIVQYGTVGIEAALMGKRVIGLWPSFYSRADFSTQVHSLKDLDKLNSLPAINPIEVRRKVLRFLYIYHKRFCQFTEYIRPENVFENRYYEGASINRLISSIESNFLEPDDDTYSNTVEAEDRILNLISKFDFSTLMEWQEPSPLGEEIRIDRRLTYRWLDHVRNKMQSGDR